MNRSNLPPSPPVLSRQNAVNRVPPPPCPYWAEPGVKKYPPPDESPFKHCDPQESTAAINAALEFMWKNNGCMKKRKPFDECDIDIERCAYDRKNRRKRVRFSTNVNVKFYAAKDKDSRPEPESPEHSETDDVIRDRILSPVYFDV